MKAAVKKAIENYKYKNIPLVVQSITYSTGRVGIYTHPFINMDDAIQFFWDDMKKDIGSADTGTFEYYLLTSDGSIYNSRKISIK